MINNAGTGAPANVEDTTVDVWDGQMDVHAKGVFLGTKYAIPEMRKVGGGSIINTSSIYGLVGSAGSTAYHAAKGAIRIFSKAAAIQYAPDGIRVNSVHPGFMRTPLTSAQVRRPRTAGRAARPHTYGQNGQRRRDSLRNALPGVRRVGVRHRLRARHRRRRHRPVAWCHSEPALPCHSERSRGI